MVIKSAGRSGGPRLESRLGENIFFNEDKDEKSIARPETDRSDKCTSVEVHERARSQMVEMTKQE